MYCNEDMIRYTEVWAKIHAKPADCGFILRYPEGMEQVTGCGCDPWHIRNAGFPELAHKIEASGAWEEDCEYTDYQWWLGRTENWGY